MAGREAWKLERRRDDKSLKLLSEEEEKKIGKQWKDKEKPGAGKGKGSYARERCRFRGQGYNPSWARSDWGNQDQQQASEGQWHCE